MENAEEQTIVRHESDGPRPLSFPQERMFLLDRIMPGLGAYNVPTLVRVRATLEDEKLRRAFELVVEDEERPLRQWDYFHCPAGTRHVIVGAGDAPCVVLMVGSRREGAGLSYPASAVAARHGASVSKATNDPDEAYADWPQDFEPVRLPWPPSA